MDDKKLSFIEALQKTAEQIRDWSIDKFSGKVDKVSGKGLSTNDYTMADKSKVASMPNDLVILDGKLYLAQDGTPLMDSAVTLPEGGGGGGGSVGSVITLTNLLDSNILTVAVGQKANLKFSFESSETSNNGTAYIYVNDVLKASAAIVVGENNIDVSPYITEGANNVKLTCMDIYSNNKSLSYSINAITLKITSTFDSTRVYEGDINVRYVPYGAIEKQIFFIVDGEEDIITVTETGKQQTYVIDAMSHGVHALKIYMTAVIDGVLVKSNELNYAVMCKEGNVTTPMIASSYDVSSLTQGELVNIPFIVYDPLQMNTEIKLSIKNNGEIYYESLRTVDSTLQYWTTRDYPVGNNIEFNISYGVISKSHYINVSENSINVSVKTTDLEFQLKASGKSNADNNRDTWSSGDVTTTFEHVNWESTGWIEDDNGDTALRLSGDSKAIINFKPFETDSKQTGRTIEMCFAIRDVNNRNAVAISCMSGGIGFAATADTCTLRSEQSEISCSYIDDEKIYITFVIEPKSEYRVMYLYINGVMSGAVQYADNDNLQQADPVAVTIGSPLCSVDLYMIRSYNSMLTMHEVLNNYIADISNVSEKLLMYEDNDIYDDFGNIDYNDLKDKIPICIITGNLPTYKGDKKKVTFSYSDPFNPSLDFEESNVTLDIQGTSSQYYNRKNWKIKMPNEHAFDLNQIPDKVACLKVDYAQGSGRNNVMIANYVHTLYGDAKTPPQLEDDRVRTSIYGRPAVLFVRENTTSPLVFYGKCNTNADKGSESVYGFDSEKYPMLQCVEFCNNVSESCLFHEEIQNEWGEDFEFRFPDGYSDISVFKQMHDWVVSTYQDGATNTALDDIYVGVDGDEYTYDTAEYRLAKFKKEFTDHFDMDFCLVYYVLTFAFLCVDQRCKNMMMLSFDGQTYAPIFYDNDTAFSIGNTGRKTFDPWTEDHDQIDNANVFNGATSALWVNFRQAFPDLIDAEYTEWRSNGLFTYDKIIEYGVKRQTDFWSAAVYNNDSAFKYLSDLYENNDSTYLYQIIGDAELDFKSFIKNRIPYLDSKWCCGDYPSDYVTLRIYTPMDENNNPIDDLPVPANPNVIVTTFSDTYAGIQYGAGSEIRRTRTEANTPTMLEWKINGSPNDLETSVFPASQISSLGDLSPLYCGTVNLSKANKLTEVIVGNGTDGYVNTNLITLSVGANKLLQKIDVRNCPNLTAPLALSQCPNIQRIYAQGSSITGVELPPSGYLKEICLPATITNLTITNQKYIEEFSLEGYSKLTTLHVEDVVNVPVEDIMLNASQLNRIRLTDVAWEAESEEAFASTIEKFENAIGMDAAENNIGKPAVVTGKVKIDSISDELYNRCYEKFPNLIIDDGSGTPYIINFLDRNGNSLYLTRVAEGSNVVDPIAAGIIERPADIVTDEYTYEFVGWSSLPQNVSQHYKITPIYKIKYTINYYNGNEKVYQYSVYQGDAAVDPVTTGAITAPTKAGTSDISYKFSGWDNLPANVQSSVSVHALFDTYWAARFWNDSTLHLTEWVIDGGTVVNPKDHFEDYTDPHRASTAQYDYHFSKWDGDFDTAMSESRDFYAVYTNTLRKYNVCFYADAKDIGNEDKALYIAQNIPYGSSASYYGDTPTKPYVDNPDEYVFKGWMPLPDNIVGETNCIAFFKFTGYLFGKLGKTVDTATEYGWVDAPNWDKINAYWNTIADDISSYKNGALSEESFFKKYPIGGRMLIPIGLSPVSTKDMIIGESVVADVEIIGHNHDNLADKSGKAPLTFFCLDLPKIIRVMHNATSTVGGWEMCTMRTFLNEDLLGALPDQLKAIIKPVAKISDGGYENQTLVTTADSCWIPSYEEVGFSTSGQPVVPGQGTAYSEIFSNSASRQKFIIDSTETGRWWLRSVYMASTSLYWRVQLSGVHYQQDPTNATSVGSYMYVAFGFCI